MSDFGMRVSHKNKDVLVDEDMDMVLTSKYANLKGSAQGNGVSNASGTRVITIAHNLGYVPFARVSTNDSDNGNRILPYQEVEAFPFALWKYYHYCDDTNLYIVLLTTDIVNVKYTYRIYYDKGKV